MPTEEALSYFPRDLQARGLTDTHANLNSKKGKSGMPEARKEKKRKPAAAVMTTGPMGVTH